MKGTDNVRLHMKGTDNVKRAHMMFGGHRQCMEGTDDMWRAQMTQTMCEGHRQHETTCEGHRQHVEGTDNM